MNISREKKTFVVSATIALSAVLVGAGALGFASNQPYATASDQLPKSLDSRQLGEGGLRADSIKVLAETADYSVWTATDRANNTCTISYAIPEGNGSSVCTSQEQFNARGVGNSMLVGEAEQGDLGVPMLQTYFFPEGVNTEVVAKKIPGSTAVGQLVVRYGPLELEKSEVLTVPAKDGEVNFTVFGRDSI